MVSLIDALKLNGVFLSEDGIRLLEENGIKESGNAMKFLFNLNIKCYSAEMLEATLNTATRVLPGSYVLQVSNVSNATAPSINQTSTLYPRMLRLRLTDGKTTIFAIEYEPIPQLNLDIAPGTKVLLKDPEFYSGRILLKRQSISVLGGLVPELYEAWKSQEVLALKNKYRSATQNVNSHPPKYISFEDFVKQRHNKNELVVEKKVAVDGSTAGSSLDIKKIEDLDLTSINDKRKEILGDVDKNTINRLGTWGTAKQMEKVEAPKRFTRERKPREYKEAAPMKPYTAFDASVTKKDSEIQKIGTIIDISKHEQELTFMIEIEKSIITAVASRKLFAYLNGISNNNISLIKSQFLKNSYSYCFSMVNGCYYLNGINGDDFSIPPTDYVIPPEISMEPSTAHEPTRAFFKRGATHHSESHTSRSMLSHPGATDRSNGSSHPKTNAMNEERSKRNERNERGGHRGGRGGSTHSSGRGRGGSTHSSGRGRGGSTHSSGRGRGASTHTLGSKKV